MNFYLAKYVRLLTPIFMCPNRACRALELVKVYKYYLGVSCMLFRF